MVPGISPQCFTCTRETSQSIHDKESVVRDQPGALTQESRCDGQDVGSGPGTTDLLDTCPAGPE